MQVSLRKKDVLSAEDFFLEKKRLRFRLTDTNGDCVNFKTYAVELDDANYYIKTRGLYKGGTIATYRLSGVNRTWAFGKHRRKGP